MEAFFITEQQSGACPNNTDSRAISRSRAQFAPTVVPASAAGSFSMQSLPQPHGTKRYATFMRAVCYRRFFITKRSGGTRQSQLRSHGVKEMMQPACRTHLSSGYFYFIWLMSCNKRCFSSAESVIHCSRSCV